MSAGPDQILPALGFVTSDPAGAVQLRIGDSAPDDVAPVSVPTLLRLCAEKGGDHPALKVKRDDEWITWSYSEYLADVRTVAKAFIKLGLERQHSVAIIGFNSPEWFLSDLGAVFAGGFAAGIYPTNSPEACKYIALDCRANIIVAEDDKQVQKILEIRNQLPALKTIIQYLGTPTADGVLSWKQLMKIGEDESNSELDARLKKIAINQCCHLVYTSGTTGQPKGVMLSHDNLTYTSKMIVDVFKLVDKEERLVSYLPLSHVAANILDIFVIMTCVGTLYFADRNALKGSLVTTLKEVQPTFFFGVPRVWEKIQEKMLEKGRSIKGWKRSVATWAKSTMLHYNLSCVDGTSLSYVECIQKILADHLVCSKVKTELGFDKCHRFYVAAAPMAQETLRYFLSLDINVLEMYGMSECTGPQNSNTYPEQKIGTVGKAMSGFHTKLAMDIDEEKKTSAESGELCFRGRNIMMGYLGKKEKTDETFDDDGWLRSGDVGEEDDDGFMTITGRIKELLITAGGENIPPIPIEDRIKAELPCLSNVMVVGDRLKYLSCLVSFKVDIDQETMEPQKTLMDVAKEWCEAHGSSATTVDEIMGTVPDQRIMEAIQKGIDRANESATSNAQRIQKFRVIPVDFSVPGGELGPTLKMKRHIILEKYRKVIEQMYT